ncbi:stage 0 sporulation protein A [Clostridia bacterium]|nr:stage 0 sporulation protein A [Clostridia bacterium]
MVPIRLVIVDDDADLCYLIASVFKRLFPGEIEIVGVAGDGEEGLSLIKALSPDAALIDVAMPKLDGIELLKLIKTRDSAPNLACILTSSMSQSFIMAEADELGADYFFVKPFQIKLLGERILRIVKNKRATANVYGAGDAEFAAEICHLEVFPQNEEPPKEAYQSQEAKVTALLKKIGLSQSTSAFAYLRAALLLCQSDCTYLDGITKRLYPEIAKTFRTTDYRVEKSIRYLFERDWNAETDESYRRLLGLSEKEMGTRPPTSVFLREVTDFLVNGK